MKNMIEIVKRKKFFILGVISLISIVFILFKTSSTKQVTTKPTPFSTNKIADFKSIVPNQTSLDRINELLGYPVETRKDGDFTINEYRSTNKYRNHTIEIKKGLATFIRQEIISGEQKTSDIQKIYGLAPYMLYSQAASATFNLFVYPNNGIAYLGHKDGTILEIWYFSPTTIEDFINNYGDGYGYEPSKVVPIY